MFVRRTTVCGFKIALNYFILGINIIELCFNLKMLLLTRCLPTKILDFWLQLKFQSDWANISCDKHSNMFLSCCLPRPASCCADRRIFDRSSFVHAPTALLANLLEQLWSSFSFWHSLFLTLAQSKSGWWNGKAFDQQFDPKVLTLIRKKKKSSAVLIFTLFI